MLTNFIRAKLSTHTVMVALGVMAFMTNHFISDPNADAWLRAHWVVKDFFQTVEATLLAYGVYHAPMKRADEV